MEERQRYRTAFAGTSKIARAFAREDMYRQESRRAVKGPGIIPLNMTHLIKPINKLLRLRSLPSLSQALYARRKSLKPASREGEDSSNLRRGSTTSVIVGH